ncbi:MAG: flagellar basal body rod C-terminal domain-containing protein [Candidatus Margulisbacteria bacterium]|nr:flagellar basal body rod C-terminal domain-containing protein [Candidatus Margulisiibacteriota bacterium]
MKKIIVIFVFLLTVIVADSTINNASQALSVSELQQGVLMENAINIKTPGYRTIKIVAYNDEKTGKKVVKRTNVFSSGPLVITNRPFDLSIEGSGFFVLSDGRGGVFLTRDGRFQVNSSMQMVSLSGGLFVLDESDSPIGLSGSTAIQVDSKGYVYGSDGNVITRLKIVNVIGVDKLRSVNNVMFYVDVIDEGQLFIPEDFVIRQGSYESSNVDYNKLMVELADKTLYTANTQMIQTRLKMLDSLNGLVNQN